MLSVSQTLCDEIGPLMIIIECILIGIGSPLICIRSLHLSLSIISEIAQIISTLIFIITLPLFQRLSWFTLHPSL